MEFKIEYKKHTDLALKIAGQLAGYLGNHWNSNYGARLRSGQIDLLVNAELVDNNKVAIWLSDKKLSLPVHTIFLSDPIPVEEIRRDIKEFSKQRNLEMARPQFTVERLVSKDLNRLTNHIKEHLVDILNREGLEVSWKHYDIEMYTSGKRVSIDVSIGSNSNGVVDLSIIGGIDDDEIVILEIEELKITNDKVDLDLSSVGNSIKHLIRFYKNIGILSED